MSDGRSAFWKDDWPLARETFKAWWDRKALALWVTAPRDEPWADVPAPDAGADLQTRWLDPAWRTQASLSQMAGTFYGGVACPIFDTNIGPGSLGLFLGGAGELAETTVWYPPVIDDPDNYPPLRFDPRGAWYRTHVALLTEARGQCDGRYLVGLPDLIENLDVVAQLRGPEAVLLDLMDRPAWVRQQIDRVNELWFECYEALQTLVSDPWGGTTWCAFSLWGPGRVAKVQCDISCAISPRQFRDFVAPALTRQCDWLDHSLYHLDGTQALPHLDNLLATESLDAIEWTPQAGIPGGGSPMWYDFYRRIKAGGKAVQAVGVKFDEVEPLIDAVGPEGMYIRTAAPSQRQGCALLRRIGWPGA